MSTGFAAATVVARNYLAHARVLARSFAGSHDGQRLAVLVVDGDGHQTEEPFDVLLPTDLGVPRDELGRLAAIYDAKELSTALKPWLLRHLLTEAEVAVYLDPDVQVFSSLDDVADLAVEREIVLTPHTLAPIPVDGRSPTELELQASGIYNLGFATVGRGAHTFLDWWADRLSRDCIVDTRHGLFVDQRWADWIPAYFPHAVARDPTLNVAHWNLHERSVERATVGYVIAGSPLRFFHFSGFDPERPHLLSAYGYRHPPRILLTRHPVLAELCADYAEQLLAAGHREQRSARYGFETTASGRRLDRTTRLLYRGALVTAEREGEAPPPDPFDPRSAEAFERWLHEAAAGPAVPAAARAAALVERMEWQTVARSSSGRFRALARRATRRTLLHRARLLRALLDELEALDARLTLRDADLTERLTQLERRIDRL